MKIVILNGAPRSGKDSLADALAMSITENDVIYFSIKHILCLGVAERYDLPPLTVWECNADSDYKDEPSPLFNGKSVRQALIYESEEVIKKEYGEQGVIIKALEDLKKVYGMDKLRKAVIICADGGFNSEIPKYGEILECPEEDIYITRILRKGYTFSGDSREFIDNPKFIFKNDGKLRTFLDYATTTMKAQAQLDVSMGSKSGTRYIKEHPAFYQ